jgi:hypothetical protein
MISLNTLTVELLRIIGEANKLCSNSLSESFLKEDMKVDVKTFVTLLNSYSNKLENILDGREYLADSGKLDRALHDVSITKDKAIKAIRGLNTVCENCTDVRKRGILTNVIIHFKEVVNTYLFAIKLYLEEEYPNVDEEILLKRYDLYEID